MAYFYNYIFWRIKIFASEIFSIEDKNLIPKNMIVLDEQSFGEIIFISPDQSILIFKNSTPQLERLHIGDILCLREMKIAVMVSYIRLRHIIKDGLKEVKG